MSDILEKNNNSNIGNEGLCPNNELKSLFFSEENIKRIQTLIKKAVYEKTNYRYRLTQDQDVMDLTIAMQAVFELYAKNIPFNYVRQVKGLNKQIVAYVVPDMITNILQHQGYLTEINSPIKSMPLPTNVRTAGRTVLPSITTTW